MTLQYNGRSGNNELLCHDADSGGTLDAIMYGCCCITCNDCYPDLLHAYTVTTSGFSGDFANTVFTVEFNGASPAQCWWNDPAPLGAGVYPTLGLQWDAGEKAWWINYHPSEYCVAWSYAYANTDSCDPTGTYAVDTFDGCPPGSGCSDPDSCDDSAGATFVVS